MEKILFTLLLVVLLTSFVSAEIIMNQPIEAVYNLGDTINLPIILKATYDISGSFNMDLLCNGNEINFYKNGVSLSYGEEMELSSSLILSKDVIGNIIGSCKIKAMLGPDSQLTEEFTVSDILTLSITSEESEFSPGQSILIEGSAVKENGKSADGFISLELVLDSTNNESGTLSQLDTIKNGYFSINITLPLDMKAGEHLIRINGYERDYLGETTNKGSTEYYIYVKQIPTNVEIIFENRPVEPGTDLKIKAILRDQTGEKIKSSAIITIKNQEDKILEQTEIETDEFLSYYVASNIPPSNWTIVAVSNKLTGKAKVEIAEKKEVEVELINKTVLVTNTGNVNYCNETILVKVGNESLNIRDCIGVDQTQRYILTAPDGEYDVEIIMGGESVMTSNVVLTGEATGIKKASKGGIKNSPIIWAFLVIVLGFIAFLIYKKGYKRSFFGRIHVRKKDKNTVRLEGHRSRWEKNKAHSLSKKPLLDIKNKAELSLSIKGDKQAASVVCLDIKNLKEIKGKEGGLSETMNKIVKLAREKNIYIYENNNNLFFILVPLMTKTFKNERTAIVLAEKIRRILLDHNKLFKQKADFGIAVNHGEIIAKAEGDILKFMSISNFIIGAKRVATLSEEEIFLTKDMSEKLGGDVKTIKHDKNKISYYTIKELRDKEGHRAFISSFLKRLEDEKKK